MMLAVGWPCVVGAQQAGTASEARRASADTLPLRITGLDLQAWPQATLTAQVGGGSYPALLGLIASDLVAELDGRRIAVSQLVRVTTAAPRHVIIAAAGDGSDELSRALDVAIGEARARLSDGDTLTVLAASDSLRTARAILPAAMGRPRTVGIDSATGPTRAIMATLRRIQWTLLIVGGDARCDGTCLRAQVGRLSATGRGTVLTGDPQGASRARRLAGRVVPVSSAEGAIALVERFVERVPATTAVYRATLMLDAPADGAPRALRVAIPAASGLLASPVVADLAVLSTPAGAGGGGEADSPRGSAELLTLAALLVVATGAGITSWAVARRRRR